MTTFPATFDELATLVETATTPGDLFDDDPHRRYRRYVNLCHPDRFPPGPEQDRATVIFQRLTQWLEQALRAAIPRAITSPERHYALGDRLATGDVADVYHAAADGSSYLLKIARLGGCNDLLADEARRLDHLRDEAGTHRYADYVPDLIETFTFAGPAETLRVNVFGCRDGFYTLRQIHDRYSAGLDPRHLAWIFKRLLTAAGFAHACDLAHGAIVPPHVLLHPENHGLMLVDWIHAVEPGRRLRFVPTEFRAWYPDNATNGPFGVSDDIFLAARCIRYLAGIDPLGDAWPREFPAAMSKFFDACLFSAVRMRPHDAWQLHEEFDELLRSVFGPRKFVRLAMS